MSNSQRERFEQFMASVDQMEFGTEAASQQPSGVDSSVYLACFNSHAGRAVLQDLYTLYVNGPSWAPGEPMEFAAYREGQRMVILEIAQRIELAASGDGDGNETG